MECDPHLNIMLLYQRKLFWPIDFNGKRGKLGNFCYLICQGQKSKKSFFNEESTRKSVHLQQDPEYYRIVGSEMIMRTCLFEIGIESLTFSVGLVWKCLIRGFPFHSFSVFLQLYFIYVPLCVVCLFWIIAVIMLLLVMEILHERHNYIQNRSN